MENSQNEARILHRGQYNYETLDGISITTLKEMRKSPKHYKHRLDKKRKETASMGFGTVTHTAVLEPERFIKDYAIWKTTDDDGNTKQRRGKAWDAFRESNASKIIVKDDEYEEAIAIRNAVRDDRIAMRYLAMGKPEFALSWFDKETGLKCRGRGDWLTTVDKRLCVVDLKTTKDASPFLFGRDCFKYAYHLQTAYYHDAVEAATGESPLMVVVAVESYAPYDAVTYIVPDDIIDIGRNEYRDLLVKLKFCQQTNDWPGQGDMLERYLTLPPWAIPEEDGVEGLGLDFGEEAS